MNTNLHKFLDPAWPRPSPSRAARWTALAIAGALLAAAGLQAADGISNVRVEQRAGTALVDIHYDLGTTNAHGLFVSVAVSTNGGLSYDLRASHFTGDVGLGVMAGTDRWIVWDAIRDWPDQYSTNVFLRLTASGAPPGMVQIPAGGFMMGDAFGEGGSDELPVHEVYVSALYMDRYEVTKALWDEVRGWANANGYDLGTQGGGRAADHPVHSVNWYDCVKWCNARSEMEGRVPAYYTDADHTTVYRTGQVQVQNGWVKWDAGYRLPTEAEWEKAARGGAEGRRFPWSDTDEITHDRANYRSLTDYAYDVSPTQGYHPTFATGGMPYTSPVGYFAPNGYGLHDMAGNVWEWCWDWYSRTYYGSSPEADPLGPASGSHRVIRGGSWYDDAIRCRVADRDFHWPDYLDFDFGFRSVLPPGQ